MGEDDERWLYSYRSSLETEDIDVVIFIRYAKLLSSFKTNLSVV